jgi:hypothetical protein
MDINKDFVRPDKHPFDMLDGYRNAYEKESVLLLIFRNAWKSDNISQPCETQHEHPSMVEDGLLEEVEPHFYRLTTKSIGLLYSVYGRKS